MGGLLRKDSLPVGLATSGRATPPRVERCGGILPAPLRRSSTAPRKSRTIDLRTLVNVTNKLKEILPNRQAAELRLEVTDQESRRH
jgi:hypothetical protein